MAERDKPNFRQALRQIGTLYNQVTGGSDPKEGMLYKLAILEGDVRRYHEDDEKMHRFIKRWLWVISVILISNVVGGRIVIDERLLQGILKGFGL